MQSNTKTKTMDQDRLTYLKSKYPNVPEHCLPLAGRKGKKKTPANQLTADIIDHVKSIGGYAIRINSQGTYSEALGKYILSGSTKGVSDIIIVYKGLFIACEVKIKDKQSEVQTRFESNVTQAGGLYIIAREIESFKLKLNTIINGK